MTSSIENSQIILLALLFASHIATAEPSSSSLRENHQSTFAELINSYYRVDCHEKDSKGDVTLHNLGT